ncbi:MAG: M66 family metalloprotease [Actinomycetota bacterium]|nr:M66 family metalloprotease [Actinomycetota bacterium]
MQRRTEASPRRVVRRGLAPMAVVVTVAVAAACGTPPDGVSPPTSAPDGSTTSTSAPDGSTTTTSAPDDSTTTTSAPDDTTTTSAPDPTTTTTAPDVGDGYDLSLERFHLNQAVPSADTTSGSALAPISGRPGLARAFVVANEDADATPVVELQYRTAGGTEGAVTLSGPAAAPTETDEGDLDTTFNAEMPAEALAVGTEWAVVIDPDDAIAEADETNNRYPADGWWDPEIVELADLDITLVPITYQGRTPDVAGNAEEYVSGVRSMLPVSGVNVSVRSEPLVWNQSSWGAATLNEIDRLRVGDGSTDYYMGIIDTGRASGLAGIAQVRGRAGISIGEPSVLAHELGHNLSLDHAPCGVDGDNAYPHPQAATGVWGWDSLSGDLLPPDHKDLMSYCQPVWISDYSFGEALDYRESAGSNSRAAFSLGAMQVSGVIEDGEVSLDAPELLPTVGAVMPESGQYAAVAKDASGAEVLRVSFDAYEIDHEGGASTFAFSVPLDEVDFASVASLSIEASGVTLARIGL